MPDVYELAGRLGWQRRRPRTERIARRCGTIAVGASPRGEAQSGLEELAAGKRRHR